MTFELMRRDPAWKLALWLTLAGAIAWPLAPHGDAPEFLVLPVGAMFLALTGRVRPHQRATLFEAALPIPARTLFLARLLSLLSMVWLPLAAGVLITALVRTTDTHLTMAMLKGGALFSVVIVTLQASYVREFAAPRWLLTVMGALGTGGCALAVLLAPTGIVLISSGTVCAALLAAAWITIPPAFQAAPVEAARPRASARRPRLRLAAWGPILRSAMPPFALLFIPVVLLQSMMGQWVYAACFCLTMLAQSRQGTRWLFALPVSHHTRFLLTAAPTLLPLLMGAVLGMNHLIPLYAEPDLVRTGGDQFAVTEPDRPGTPNVQVPLEFWRRAAGGQTPEIRAPWGESVHPSTFQAMGMTFYNPYQVEQANTAKFMEWQFARATTDLYGRPIERRQFAAARRAGLHSVMSTPRVQVLNLAALFLIAMAVTSYAEFAGWHRLGRLSAVTRGVTLGILFGLPLYLVVGYDVLHMQGTPGMMSSHLLAWLVLWCARALPQGLAATVVIAATPAALSYLAVERLATQSEMTGAAGKAGV